MIALIHPLKHNETESFFCLQPIANVKFIHYDLKAMHGQQQPVEPAYD